MVVQRPNYRSSATNHFIAGRNMCSILHDLWYLLLFLSMYAPTKLLRTNAYDSCTIYSLDVIVPNYFVPICNCLLNHIGGSISSSYSGGKSSANDSDTDLLF